MKLRPYQAECVDFLVDHPRCNLFVPMGGGKSLITLTAIDRLALAEDILPVLIVAPLRVAMTTWPDEVAKWPHLSHLRVSVMCGTPAQRLAALRTEADIYTINFENVPWLAEQIPGGWPFRMVVVDESSRLSGFRLRQGTLRASVLGKRAHMAARYVGLTGTPAGNGIAGLWGQMWFVDKGTRLGRTFSAFSNRWFRAKPNGFGMEPMPHAQTEIQGLIKDACASVDLADHLDIQQPVVNIIRVKLPPVARKVYDEIEKNLFAEVNGTELEVFSAAAKTIKTLQIASGASYTDTTGDAWIELHDAKLQALDSVIAEANGNPVLVAYHFRSTLARLRKAFPQGRSLDKNPKTIRDWNAGRIPVLFAHPASAGHGLSLQDGGHILCYVESWWDMEQHAQILERIGPARQAQSGYRRPVYVYYIVAERTVDELVLRRLATKKSVQETLLEAMRTQPATEQ